MFRFAYVRFIILLAIALSANGQYYKIKYIIDSNKGRIYAPYYSYSQPGYNRMDLENDGVSEIVYRIVSDSVIFEMYDGATYQLKYKTKAYYKFDNKNYRLDAFAGFYDINGSGKRKAVFFGFPVDSIGSYSLSRLLFLNQDTDQLEYVSIESGNPDILTMGYCDLDKDGFMELITSGFILGRSATPVVQPIASPKILSPLSKISPNPIIGIAKIEYTVPMAGLVKIDIFNPAGQLLRTLVNGNKKNGNFTETWDGRSAEGNFLGAGQYFYRIQIGEFFTEKKVVMLR